MDCIQFMDELESMAQLAVDRQPEELDDGAIQRWQRLFGYSYAEGSKRLEDHRTNICRQPVSNAHWDLVWVEKEAQGYDKEACEHACQQLPQGQQVPIVARTSHKASKYLVKMEGPLGSIEAIKTAAGHSIDNISKIPGTDDSGESASFCVVSATAKENILTWLAEARSLFQPTFIRYSKADKAVSSDSPYPTLGIDTTLPQHRLFSIEIRRDPRLLPLQDEYPVWYFFYGTLADPAVLGRLVGGEIDPVYRAASISGGTLTTWGGKYNALVEPVAGKRTEVVGSAFLVLSAAHEDVLRCYETDKYEVVRCQIDMLDDRTSVRGLTFRFVTSGT